LDSLGYCQKEKGLELYAWCIMTNHIHLIVGSIGEHEIQGIIRDFKKYTSVKLVQAIKDNHQESRKKWILWLLKKLTEKSSKHQKYCFWQDGYHPIELSTNEIMQQKLDYVYLNPVKEGIVSEPEDYLCSSARDYAGIKGLLNIKHIG
jgi:putative transposase